LKANQVQVDWMQVLREIDKVPYFHGIQKGSGAKKCDRQEGCENWGRDYAAITAPQISGEAFSLRRKRPRENCFL
jgi:hypothetical protein